MKRGVIRAKLAIPSLPEERVERPELERRLAALIARHRVVVVSATAGAGKTTAVASAVGRLDQPVAWLTVDRTDAAPGRLVTYLEAALASAVPPVADTATRALAAGLPHAEAAGLLAEAIGGEQTVFVLDDLERLNGVSEAWDVLEGLLRYAPAGMRVVLVSRRAIPVHAVPAPTAVATLAEADLAFTPEEAARALALHGEAGIDATAVVDATGGWVTGILFEAWRSAGHINGAGGAVDPLHGYLAAHIVGQLAPAEREFLEATAVLDEVTAPRAEALGVAGAAEHLAGLRLARLPVSWAAGGAALRCHPRFREYLLTALDRRGEAAVSRLRVAHGRLLAQEGHDEEATEELLRAGAPAEALASAERAIAGVVERLDLPIAERWLEALAGLAPRASTALTTAELLIALGSEDFRRGERVADGLAARAEREPLARESDLLAVLMAWCYSLFGRMDDARTVVAAAPRGYATDVWRYASGHMEPSGPRAPRPAPRGGPLDALLLAIEFYYGHYSELDEHEGSDWVDAVAAGPRRIGTLRALGQTQRALELYEAAQARGRPSVQLDGHVGPELLLDAGRGEDARAAARRGRELARGTPLFELQTTITAAKLALRLDRDPQAARTALDEAERYAELAPYPLMTEQIDTWYGLAQLLGGDDETARTRLRRAVASMTAADRLPELPTAAVYLAEAEWRQGDDVAADAAADVALEAAHGQGSNHILLQALRDFPAVASRRIDVEPDAESAWHELGRALIAQGITVEAPVRSSVELLEFGRCAIVVDGVPVRPRIAKSSELLAYLTTRPGLRAARDELLDALFDGRTDPSTRAYLRQAIRWLRHVLGTPHAVVAENGDVRLGDAVTVAGESTRLEILLAEAARLQGDDRLQATLDALQIADRGEFLPAVHTHWADARREALASLVAGARLEAAELAFAAGRFDDAERLVGRVLEAEPFRETAWRLRMRLADALGAGDSVIRAYQGCERALAQVGTTPSRTTRELLERLRR